MAKLARSETYQTGVRLFLEELKFEFWTQVDAVVRVMSQSQCLCSARCNFQAPMLRRRDEKHAEMAFRCSKFSCDIAIPLRTEWLLSVATKYNKTASNYSRTVLAVLNGMTYKEFASTDYHPIAKKTWKNWTSEINERIIRFFVRSSSELRQNLKDKVISKPENRIRLAIDGGWAHRGWHSKQFTLTVRDIDEDKIFYSLVVDQHKSSDVAGDRKKGILSSFPLSSKLMEAEAIDEFAKDMEAEGLWPYISLIVTDGDQQNPKILSKYATNTVFAKDPGHAKKNFQKRLIAVFGQGEKYKAYPRRIAKMFIRLIIFLCRILPGRDTETYHNRVNKWNVAWPQVFKHYTACICSKRCPCRIMRATENGSISPNTIPIADISCSFSQSNASLLTADTIDLDEFADDIPEGLEQVRNHIWLDSKDLDHQVFIKKLSEMWEDVGRSALECLYAANTCNVESSHARRLALASKKSSYPKTYAARSHLSSLLENHSYQEVGTQLIEGTHKFAKEDTPDGFKSKLIQCDKSRDFDKIRRSTEEYKRETRRQRASAFIEQVGRTKQFSHITNPEYRKHLMNDKLSPTPTSVKKSRTASQKQSDLKDQFENNTRSEVKQCPSCKRYYKTSHKACPAAPKPSTTKPKRKGKRARSEIPTTSSESNGVINIDNSRDSNDEDLELAIALSLSEIVQTSTAKSTMKLQRDLYTAITATEDFLNVKFQLNAVLGDGNCMFRSLAAALNDLSDEIRPTTDWPRTHAAMRERLTNGLEMMSKDKFNIGSITASLEEHVMMDAEQFTSFKAYIENMKRSGVHGRQFELMVAARILSVNIEVYCHGPRPFKFAANPNPRTAASAPTIRLTLTFQPEHYQWLSKLP